MPNRYASRWLLVAIASTVIVATGLLVLVRWLVPPSVLTANNDAAGSYLQTLGTIYAVLLAFVVFVVWSQYNDTRTAVEHEANDLADLYRVMHGFGEAQRNEVRRQVQAYVEAVVTQEWAAMARGGVSAEAARSLDAIWEALDGIEPGSSREEALYSEALSRFDDLSDSRTHRITMASLRLPPTMWTLLVVGGALTVGSMVLFGVPYLWSHAVMTAALGGLIAFVLYVILDLDNPFWGDWRISAEPIRRSVPGSSPSLPD
jgi:hypothetical protein